MDQWEYACLGMFIDQGRELLIWREASGEPQLIEVDQKFSFMAHAGREGWELVTAVASVSSENLYFKRRHAAS